MKTEHTPGPWQLSHELTEGFSVVKQKGQGNNLLPVAIAVFTKNYHIENVVVAKANARLIAAAPELLAALELLVAETSYFEEWKEKSVVKNARTAIAKATTPKD